MWVTVLSFFRDAAKQREEDERKRKISERQKKRDTVEKRCAQKAKKYLSSDRLKLDKQYLNGLSRGIGPKPGLDVDDVELGIAENAYEAFSRSGANHLRYKSFLCLTIRSGELT